MIELNSNQTAIVKAVIEERGLQYGPLKDELLDHYCCLVESYIEDGKSFEESLKSCVSDFESSDLKAIEQIMIQQSKNKLTMMRNVALLATVVFLITSTFLFSQKTEIPSLRPVNDTYKVSAGFGKQLHPIKKMERHHDGIDISAPIGTEIYAPANGMVVKVKSNDVYGKHLTISHSEGFETMYAHLSEIEVKTGDQVNKGQVIGKIGNTGLSTGPHLHYEISKEGKKLNPADFFTETKL